MNPLVSIIIPAYNAERYIARAIKSALNQTWRDIEVIVVDDGSTDRTAEIVRSFKDPRVRYIYQQNQNVGSARNHGIKESKGKYITFLDADDEYLPEKVEKQVEFLEQNPKYQVVYCDTIQFYSDNPDKLFIKKGEHPSGDIFEALLHSSVINPNTVMMAKELLVKVGMFDERPNFPEDWELWLRIARAGYLFGHIHEGLVKVEMRKDSKTTIEVNLQAKKYLLEIFQNLFSVMTPEERERYKTDSLLAALKRKILFVLLITSMPPPLKSPLLFIWKLYQSRKYETLNSKL